MKLYHMYHVSLPAQFGAVALGALLAVAAVPASADEEQHTTIPADEVKFNPGPPTLPTGAEVAVLLGNPAGEGPFVIRLKFPAGYAIAPHRHPKEEHVTVISGGLGLATGETHDSSAAPILPPGSFVRIPVGMAHFAWTERETVVQINSIGPFGIEYVNPEDDPRTN